jgi:Lysylphosphatidylglycerol synthase TM region
VTPVIRGLLLVVGLSVAVLLVRHVGFWVVAGMIVSVGWALIAVAGVYAVQVAIRAVALWRVVLPHPVRYQDVLRIRLSTEAVEMLTFTGPFLAEPAKGWLLIRRGMPTAAAIAAVIAEFLLYTAVSAVVAIVALVLLLRGPALPGAARPAAVVVLVVMSAFVGACVFASITGVGLMVPTVRATRRLIGPRAVSAAEQFAETEDLIITFLHDQPRRLVEVLAIETAAHALLVVEMWIIIAALGFSISWIDALILEGGVKFVGVAFAFIPGQLGASESTYGLLAAAIGLPVAAGVTVALVRRLRALPVAVLGLFVGASSGRSD